MEVGRHGLLVEGLEETASLDVVVGKEVGNKLFVEGLELVVQLPVGIGVGEVGKLWLGLGGCVGGLNLEDLELLCGVG